MQVSKGHHVRLEYELRVKGGDVIEASNKAGPVVYVHGEDKMPPALQKRIEGMRVGEAKKGEMPGSELFGKETDAPVSTFTRSSFPKDAKLEKGTQFEAKGPGGQPVILRVVEAKGDDVKVRLLPLLFDKTFEFKLKVVSIEDPATHKREHLGPPPPPPVAQRIDDDALLVEE